MPGIVYLPTSSFSITRILCPIGGSCRARCGGRNVCSRPEAELRTDWGPLCLTDVAIAADSNCQGIGSHPLAFITAIAEGVVRNAISDLAASGSVEPAPP